jgi:hypothetical protein
MTTSQIRIKKVLRLFQDAGFTRRNLTVRKSEGHRCFYVSFNRQYSWDCYFVEVGLDFDWIERSFKVHSASGCMIQSDVARELNMLVGKTSNVVDFELECWQQVLDETIFEVINSRLQVLNSKDAVKNALANSSLGSTSGILASPALVDQLFRCRDTDDWW